MNIIKDTFRAYPVEFYRSNVLQWRWRIKASNGQIIAAATESFWHKDNCIRNAELTMVSLREYFKSEGSECNGK